MKVLQEAQPKVGLRQMVQRMPGLANHTDMGAGKPPNRNGCIPNGRALWINTALLSKLYNDLLARQ